MSIDNQIAIIFAGINGYLDNIALDKINQYETELTEYLSTNNQNTLDAIIKSGKLDEKNEKELKKAIESFSNTFNN